MAINIHENQYQKQFQPSYIHSVDLQALHENIQTMSEESSFRRVKSTAHVYHLGKVTQYQHL